MVKGTHWMFDIYDFPDMSADKSLEVLIGAAESMGCSVVDKTSIETKKERVAVVIIDESHLTIHDYKNKYAALDIFTCGEKDVQAGFDYIQKEIGFKNYKPILKVDRFDVK